MSYENDDRARIVRLYYVIGMAFLFTAIKVALTVIIDKLRMQIMMNGLVVFSLNQYKFNPHPIIPAPTLGGGEEAEKQGITSAYSLGSPCFSVKSIYTYLPRAPLSSKSWKLVHTIKLIDANILSPRKSAPELFPGLIFWFSIDFELDDSKLLGLCCKF